MRGHLIVAGVLSGLALLATAVPAEAHAELVASTPAEGAELATAPRQVQLTFNEPVRLQPNPVTIAGPGGVTWTVGPATVAGAVVTAPVEPAGPAGPYTLTYRVVSVDGDATAGTVTFTLAAPAPVPTTVPATTPAPATAAAPNPTGQPATTTSPGAAQDTDDEDGVPAWVWLLAGTAALVAVIGMVALRARR